MSPQDIAEPSKVAAAGIAAMRRRAALSAAPRASSPCRRAAAFRRRSASPRKRIVGRDGARAAPARRRGRSVAVEQQASRIAPRCCRGSAWRATWASAIGSALLSSAAEVDRERDQHLGIGRRPAYRSHCRAACPAAIRARAAASAVPSPWSMASACVRSLRPQEAVGESQPQARVRARRPADRPARKRQRLVRLSERELEQDAARCSAATGASGLSAGIWPMHASAVSLSRAVGVPGLAASGARKPRSPLSPCSRSAASALGRAVARSASATSSSRASIGSCRPGCPCASDSASSACARLRSRLRSAPCGDRPVGRDRRRPAPRTARADRASIAVHRGGAGLDIGRRAASPRLAAAGGRRAQQRGQRRRGTYMFG